MDYIDHVSVSRHADWDAFHATIGDARLVLLTTRGSVSAYDFAFRPDDILLFGKESAGAPPHVHAAATGRIRLPMRPEVRSLNLAMSAGLAVAEALRQTGGLSG
jgi:tRNA (cytidine/uridine-2'-O-)-methyltransferase